MKRAGSLVNQEQRFATGMIATLRMSHGALRAQHFTGTGTEATRAVAAFCDTHGARIVSLCTPDTIYRDLQGSRAIDVWTAQRRRRREHRVDLPEDRILAAIGRTDLLERVYH